VQDLRPAQCSLAASGPSLPCCMKSTREQACCASPGLLEPCAARLQLILQIDTHPLALPLSLSQCTDPKRAPDVHRVRFSWRLPGQQRVSGRGYLSCREERDCTVRRRLLGALTASQAHPHRSCPLQSPAGSPRSRRARPRYWPRTLMRLLSCSPRGYRHQGFWSSDHWGTRERGG